MRAQRGGRIVLISSIGGVIGIPFQAYYSASKFALEGFAESLAYEVAPFGVHMTLVQPGNIADRLHGAAGRSPMAAAGDTVYAAAMTKAISLMERDEANGAPAEQVAAVVQRVLSARQAAAPGLGRQGRRAGRPGGEEAAAIPRVRGRGQGKPRCGLTTPFPFLIFCNGHLAGHQPSSRSRSSEMPK